MKRKLNLVSILRLILIENLIQQEKDNIEMGQLSALYIGSGCPILKRQTIIIKKEDRMIPKDLVNAIKVFEKHGFNIDNVKKAVLQKAQKQLDGISKKKPKPVIKSVEKKTDEQLIAEHIQSNGVTKERKGPAKYWDGVKWCDYNNDILGKKEIASRVKLPFTDLTVNIVLIMIIEDNKQKSDFLDY